MASSRGHSVRWWWATLSAKYPNSLIFALLISFSHIFQAISISVLFIVLYLIKLRLSRGKVQENPNLKPTKKERGKGNVDSVFFKRIVALLKIVIPSWKSKEVLNLSLLTVSLVIRTFLSIYITSINGLIVKAIVKRDYALFVQRVTRSSSWKKLKHFLPRLSLLPSALSQRRL